MDPKVVDSIIEMIKGKFRKMTKMRGKKHTFVCMGIDLADNGRVKILMSDYISESILSFGEDLDK